MIVVEFVLLKFVSEVFDWPLFALLSFFLLVISLSFLLRLVNTPLMSSNLVLQWKVNVTNGFIAMYERIILPEHLS